MWYVTEIHYGSVHEVLKKNERGTNFDVTLKEVWNGIGLSFGRIVVLCKKADEIGGVIYEKLKRNIVTNLET